MTKAIPTKAIPTKTVPAKSVRANAVQAVRVGLLAALALLAAGAAPAEAASLEPLPGNWLYLTVTRGNARPQALDSDRAGETPFSDPRGTLLLCDPPQGHPHAAQACEELRAAEGDISRIPPRADVLCPLIYAPVTASAQGVWDGRRVTYTHTFSNSCVMGAETGTEFELSD